MEIKGDLDEATIKEMEEVYYNTPYFRSLPCKIEYAGYGHSQVSFDISKHLCNYRGIASGGVLAAFCDTLMGMACRTMGYQITTLEINMNYIRSIPCGAHITGYGDVVHHGGRTFVVTSKIVDEAGNVAVLGRSSFYILKTVK